MREIPIEACADKNRLWEELNKAYTLDAFVDQTGAIPLKDAYGALFDVVGGDSILTAYRSNPFFATRALKLIALQGIDADGQLTFKKTCAQISDLLPKELLAESFAIRARDTVIALSMIHDMGREPDGSLTFRRLHQELAGAYVDIDKDFLASPADSVLGFGYGRDSPRADDSEPRRLRDILDKYGLHVRPSQVFGLSYRNYPELEGFKMSTEIKSTLDAAYSLFHRPRLGVDKPMNIIDDTVQQYLEGRDANGLWRKAGKINWLGIRLLRGCPQRCWYCDLKEDTSDLSRDEWLEKLTVVIDEVTESGKRPGVLFNLSGGEPLIMAEREYDYQKFKEQTQEKGGRVDSQDVCGLLSLIRFIKQRGGYVSMNSTLLPIGLEHRIGGQLRGSRLAEELVESGVDLINVSVESVDKDRHDLTTAVPGSWEKTMLGFRELQKHMRRLHMTTKLSVNHVLTNGNFRELPALVEFLGENITAVDEINPLPIKGEENRRLFLSLDEIREFKRDILPRITELADKYRYRLLKQKAAEIYGTDEHGEMEAAQGRYHHWEEGIPCYTSRVSAYIDYCGDIGLCSYNADANIKDDYYGLVTEIPGVSLKDIMGRRTEKRIGLPCGQLCDAFCGPDMERLNRRIHERIQEMDRRQRGGRLEDRER